MVGVWQEETGSGRQTTPTNAVSQFILNVAVILREHLAKDKSSQSLNRDPSATESIGVERADLQESAGTVRVQTD